MATGSPYAQVSGSRDATESLAARQAEERSDPFTGSPNVTESPSSSASAIIISKRKGDYMHELIDKDRQSVIKLLQKKIDGLPAAAKKADILKFFDMLDRSDELGLQKEALAKGIEEGREPFVMIFHAGSVEADPDHYVAFQLEAYKRHWTLRAGVLDPTGSDFLVPHHALEIFYRDYTDFSVDVLASELFGAMRALLSGELAVLESRSGDQVYAAELLLRGKSDRAINATWFNGKNIPDPKSTVLQQNSLLKGESLAPAIFLAKQNGEFLFKGRAFTGKTYSPLTLEEFQKYAGKLVTNPSRRLSGLSIGFMLIFVISIFARNLDEGIYETYALVGVGAAFLVLLVLMIRWFPQLAKMFWWAWIVPLIAGAAVFGVFLGVGSLAYSLAPGLAEIVDNGENTALSMVIVLGWFLAGLVAAGFAFFRTSRKLADRYSRRLESRR